MSLQIDFISFLLDAHFDLRDEEAAKAVGNIGFAGTLASISIEMVLGTLMDLVGRKVPMVTGMLLAGLMTALIPFPRKLAWLYCIRCFINIGIQPLMQSPFSVDYIQKESQGLYGAYSSIITTLAAILGSTVAIQLEQSIGIDYVYFFLGGLVFIIAAVLCFGLKDLKTVTKDLNKDEQLTAEGHKNSQVTFSNEHLFQQ